MVLWIEAWRFEYGAEAHIKFWIDNTSAVAWAMARSCRHENAQAVLRVMALPEASFHVYISADHVPGVLNVWADAGSRLWTSCEALKNFNNINGGYVQEGVDAAWRKPSTAWALYCKMHHSPAQAIARIAGDGNSGAAGAQS